MKISTINNSQQNWYRSNNISKNAVTFSGVSEYLVGMVIREGCGALKSRKKAAYLNALNSSINSEPSSDRFLYSLKALIKTPNNFYGADSEGWVYWLAGPETPRVHKMRLKALSKLNDVPNKNDYTIQTKKDFFRSVLENGHELTDIFLKQFSLLNDSIYKSFKEEIVDTCLFSTKYNQIRHPKQNDLQSRILKSEYCCSCRPFQIERFMDWGSCPPPDGVKREEVFLEQVYNNLKLISTLDKSAYREYLVKRRDVIERSKHHLQQHFNRIYSLTQFDSSRPLSLINDFNINLKTI